MEKVNKLTFAFGGDTNVDQAETYRFIYIYIYILKNVSGHYPLSANKILEFCKWTRNIGKYNSKPHKI